MKAKAPPITLEERLAGTVPEFRARLAAIGLAANKTILEVFALWREYCQECADQSALVSEFVQWKRAKLGLTVEQARDLEVAP